VVAVGGRGNVFLQTSPLIGGPSWLPLHVKVVLETSNNVIHTWDFLPQDATELSTLKRLLFLQPVPAEIRYQTKPLSSVNPSQQEALDLGSFDVVLRGDGNMPVETDLAFSASEERVILRAQNFCKSYHRREELHLVENNCWTFALQLYEHLTSENDHGKEEPVRRERKFETPLARQERRLSVEESTHHA
jgi:hypothetical protein